MFKRVVNITAKAAIALSVIAISHSNVAAAEDGLDIRVCAALYPCDGEGNVVAEIAQKAGDCLEVYAQQCAMQQASKNQSAKLSCENKSAKLERKIAYLRGQMRSMKSRYDRLLRRSR